MANQKNPNKEDMNQNQHTNKAMGASASAQGTGAHQPDIENFDQPENVGGERPNRSNTGSKKSETGERFDLQSKDEPFAQHNDPSEQRKR